MEQKSSLKWNFFQPFFTCYQQTKLYWKLTKNIEKNNFFLPSCLCLESILISYESRNVQQTLIIYPHPHQQSAFISCSYFLLPLLVTVRDASDFYPQRFLLTNNSTDTAELENTSRYETMSILLKRNTRLKRLVPGCHLCDHEISRGVWWERSKPSLTSKEEFGFFMLTDKKRKSKSKLGQF